VEVFTSYENFRSELEKAGAINLVSDVITSEPDSAAMIRVATGSFANLVISDLLRSEVDSFQMTTTLCKLAELSRGRDLSNDLHKAAVAEVYRAMRNLAYNNAANTGTIATAGGIDAIKAVLKPAQDPEVLVQALGFVLNLALDHDVNTQRLGEAGLIEQVMAVLTAQFELGQAGKQLDDTLLAHALEALLIVSTQPAGLATLKVDSSKVLIEGMKMSAINSKPGLVRAMIAIIGNMATESKQSHAVIDVHGAEAVVNAMKLHSSDYQLQEAAAGALRNFCVSEKGRARVVNVDGIAVVIDAMRTHAEAPRVLQNGISALINLAQNNNKNKAFMRRADHSIGKVGLCGASGCATAAGGGYVLPAGARCQVTRVSV